ncbi:MAG: hypothetical protein NWF03_07970 [Candidatus Bathyarchaeota archaeon]|nr:hypothetical protein [Candidatus Bathyarchaeota archaeon]
MITTCRRFKRNKRGVSNIIVVALSLVVILAIVSNIVLWNYEMTQLDYEKLKEEISIINVESVTTESPWFTAASEFTVSSGARTQGTYLDTQAVDTDFERFTETTSSGSGSTTFIKEESFEDDWPPKGWSVTLGSNWYIDSEQAYDGKFSAFFEGEGWGGGGASGYLTTPSMDCSDAESIDIDFWWFDQGLDSDDFELELFDGNKWISYRDLNSVEFWDGWHHYTETIKDGHYFVSDFQIRWYAKTVRDYEYAGVDLVTVNKNAGIASFSLGFSNSFDFDVSEYPLDSVQTVEIQLGYRASDVSDTWYLQAYNWASGSYSDSGFNITTGHNPTTGWDYYTVNMTDAWQNYVRSDGTINIRLVDQNPDATQTTVDIDFFGVKLKTDGTKFTFRNHAGLTAHIVSVWVIDSTGHERYDVNFFVNSAATKDYTKYGIVLPETDYTIKVVTERGNIAVYS